jgi:predicted ABC-type sugar transport system permease subunit
MLPQGGGAGWLATAFHYAVHHWRQGLEIAGMGVCTFASAGACLIAGGVYTAANWIADAADTGEPFGRKAKTDLALKGGTTLIFGNFGKVVGGVLSAKSLTDDMMRDLLSLVRQHISGA